MTHLPSDQGEAAPGLRKSRQPGEFQNLTQNRCRAGVEPESRTSGRDPTREQELGTAAGTVGFGTGLEGRSQNRWVRNRTWGPQPEPVEVGTGLGNRSPNRWSSEPDLGPESEPRECPDLTRGPGREPRESQNQRSRAPESVEHCDALELPAANPSPCPGQCRAWTAMVGAAGGWRRGRALRASICCAGSDLLGDPEVHLADNPLHADPCMPTVEAHGKEVVQEHEDSWDK